MLQDTNAFFIEGLRVGNEKVLLLIYDKLFAKVKYFILKNRGSQIEAEEVFQEALFQLIKKLKVSEIQIESTFEGYFFTICKNLWRKELISKKKWVRNEEVITLASVENTISDSHEKEKRWELFEQKLEELSENCRELLKEYFNKVPYDEIVKKFNYSSENVAFQRMFKCKKKLKDLVKKDPRFKNLS